MQDQLLDDQDIKFPSDWYPSAWRRFLAALIDSLVLMVIVGFLNGLLFSFTGENKIFAPLFLIILFNPSRKNLFDHLAGTVCINKKHPTASK